MNNHYMGRATSHTSNTSISQHEMRANTSIMGVLPSLERVSLERQRASAASSFEDMVQSLHELFEHDRQVASQLHSTRCGICYLHFLLSELQYRDEGYYVCPQCSQTIGHQYIPMLHKQQKL